MKAASGGWGQIFEASLDFFELLGIACLHEGLQTLFRSHGAEWFGSARPAPNQKEMKRPSHPFFKIAYVSMRRYSP